MGPNGTLTVRASVLTAKKMGPVGPMGPKIEFPLLPFQDRFMKRALAPGIDLAALSVPRGGGKSFLCGYLLARALSPDDPLFQPGTESILISGSTKQARIIFKYTRRMLAGIDAYRFSDSNNDRHILHKPTKTRLVVYSRSAKTAFGIGVENPFVVADEPGSWEVVGGKDMWDVINGSLGKAGQHMRAIFVGTLAPGPENGWWHSIVKQGSYGSRYVQTLQADRAKWNDLREIYRVNPLAKLDKPFAKKLREQLAEGERDSAAKAFFLNYRLNLPSADEDSLLFTVEQWQAILARPVAARDGQPIWVCPRN